jgi:hypothetical protein
MRIAVEITAEVFAISLFLISGAVWLLIFTPGF